MGEAAGQEEGSQTSDSVRQDPLQPVRHIADEGLEVLRRGRGFGIIPGRKAEDLERGRKEFSSTEGFWASGSHFGGSWLNSHPARRAGNCRLLAS